MLFNHGHGPRGGVGDWEVRAAVLQSAYGRGLVYASKAKCGQALGYYGGGAITLQEYYELHEKTVCIPRRHPL